MTANGKSIGVVGASGLVGSNIVKAGLERGYAVNGTMRDRNAPNKAPFLNALPGVAEGLQLFSAEMAEEGSFDAALAGCDGVFIASLIPMYAGPTGTPAREMDDEQGYAEIIMPTVNGCLNAMRSAIRQGVKNVVICSSTRVRTHYSHQMTAAARAIAAMKFLMLRSKRVAIRRQSLRRQNMRSMMLRCL